MPLTRLVRKIVVFLSFLFVAPSAIGQISPKDSAINVPMIIAQYGYQIPGADLADRFGNNSTVGAQFLFKSYKRLVLSADWNYMFGNKIKEPNLFNNISTQPNANGVRFILDKAGSIATTRLWERGFQSHLSAGTTFWRIGPNKNCGFIFTVGAGILYHKIRIEDIGNNSPQLSKEYKKGYDRLTYGLSTKQFLGYVFLSDKRLFNFYGGFELVQGFTQNRRGYNYDTQAYDNEKRLDLLSGFKVGLIIPLYRKVPYDYYFY